MDDALLVPPGGAINGAGDVVRHSYWILSNHAQPRQVHDASHAVTVIAAANITQD